MANPKDVALIKNFVDRFKNGKGKMDAVDELLDKDFVHHFADPRLPSGIAGIKMIGGIIFSVFPDVHVEIEFVVQEGNIIAEHSVAHATHAGAFQDLQPTGKQVTWTENNIYRIKDGKIAEMWNCGDLLAIMYQIDVL